MDPVIRFTNLTKQFGSHVALNRVSLEIDSGSVFAILGENGAGKTTAIRILLGLLRPDAGEVHVLNLDSTRHGLAIRRRVGYVAERPTLYEWMTVSEIGWFAVGGVRCCRNFEDSFAGLPFDEGCCRSSYPCSSSRSAAILSCRLF